MMASQKGAVAKKRSAHTKVVSFAVDKNGCLKFTHRKHSEELMSGFNRFRQEEKYCDFIVKVGAESIPCHRAILELNSDYFSAMFSSGMTESAGGEVRLDEELDADAVKIIIDYMYTGKFDVKQDKVQDLLVISDHLQLPHIRQTCLEYIATKIDFVNCVDMYQLGHQFCYEDIIEKSSQMIRQLFVTLVEQERLCPLPVQLLMQILSWKDLALEPDGEQTVMTSVLDWVSFSPLERRVHFPELLANVRVAQLSDAYLHDVEAHALLREHPGLQDALSQRLQQKDADEEKRLRTETLYVVGGYLQSRTGPHCPRLKRALCLKSNSLNLWEGIADLPIAGSGVLTLTPHRHVISFLYEWRHHEVSGDSIEEYRAVMEYDHLEDKWFPITDAFCRDVLDTTYECLKRGGAATFCTYSHRLYTVSPRAVHGFSIEQDDGDLVVRPASHRVFSTPPEFTGSGWKYVDFGVVLCAGKLYCVGGSSMKAKFEFSAVAWMWVLDLEDGTWTQVKSMNMRRARMALVEKDGLIYALGGYNGVRLASGEVYNPATNTWRPIASMEKPRTHCSACVFKDKIYVMGGKSYNTSSLSHMNGPRKVLKFTEIYDPKTDRWSMGPIMPEARCMYGAAVV